VWVLALLAIGVVTWLAVEIPTQGWMMLTYPVGIFMLLVYLGAASQSSRFFVEARRSGLIELMLATPLTERKIVLGQWRALLRTFSIPVGIVLLLQLGTTGISHVSMRRTMSAAASAAAAASASVSTNSSGGSNYVANTTNTSASFAYSPPSLASITAQEWLTTIVDSLTTLATSAANLVALCWFGMWMGMTSKNANLATLKTFLFVQIVPFVVIWIGSWTVIGSLLVPYLVRRNGSASTSFMIWYPFLSNLLMSILFLAKDIGFFIWSRKNLFFSFRAQAVRSISPPVLAIPPPVPPPIPAPPVIPSPAT
jgi:hypothetical protein